MTQDELKLAAEFHRGYEAGLAARDVAQWQLDRERAEVVRGLLALEFNGVSYDNLSKIARVIHKPMHGWIAGACRQVRDELVRLLGGDDDTCDSGPDCANPDIGGADNVHAPITTYDELGNERHKAVCKLQKMHLDTGSAVKKLAIALGVKWNADNAERSVAVLQSRLIHLLGGDQPTLSDLYGMWHDEDECNFSTPKSDIACPMPWDNPAETSEDAGNHVTQDTGYAEIDKNGESCQIGQDNGTCPNDVPIASITDESAESLQEMVERGEDEAPVMTITDELRTFTESTELVPGMSLRRCRDCLLAIADRIDEQWERVCKLWERTAIDNAQDVHDAMEAECNKLQAEVDRQSKLASVNAEAFLRANAECRELRTELEKTKEQLEASYVKQRALKAHIEKMQGGSKRWRDKYMEAKTELSEADAAIENWRERGKSFAESERLRIELQAKLDRISEMVAS